MDRNLRILVMVEKPDISAALAEDRADERRACLPAAGGVEINMGGVSGSLAAPRVTVELRFNIHAHSQQPVVGAQH
jgi:hypothetical protein